MSTDPKSSRTPAAPEPRGQPIGSEVKDRKSIVIGRALDCDVVVKDEKASRRHCKLSREGTSFILEDLASKNGTFVNGERIKGTVTLKPNQSFSVGDTLFYVAT